MLYVDPYFPFIAPGHIPWTSGTLDIKSRYESLLLMYFIISHMYVEINSIMIVLGGKISSIHQNTRTANCRDIKALKLGHLVKIFVFVYKFEWQDGWGLWVCIIGIFADCAIQYHIIPNVLYNTQTTSFVDVTLVHHLLGLEDILVMHVVDALGYACHHACRWTPPHPTGRGRFL